MKEISVLLAVYNGEDWIERCIISILGQTFEEFEFIIINDGSTDSTEEIVFKYKNIDSRIKYYYKKNSGLTRSLNYGLQKASGKWIARIDVDDYSYPNRLESQLNFVRENPDAIVVGSNFIVKRGNSIIYTSKLPFSHSKLVSNIERMKAFFPHSSAFFLRKSAEQIGFYRSNFYKSQDLDLWLRLSEIGKIYCLKERLVIINDHDKRITADNYNVYITERRQYDLNPEGTVQDPNRHKYYNALITNWVVRRRTNSGFETSN